MLGTAHRVGRDAPEYQLARARELIDFLRRYLGSQQLFYRGYAKDLEKAKGWLTDQLEASQSRAETAARQHEQDAAQLEARLKEADRAWKERGDWIAKLEEAKVYLQSQVDGLNARVDALTGQLESESADRAKLVAHVGKIQESLWYRIGVRVGLPEWPVDKSQGA